MVEGAVQQELNFVEGHIDELAGEGEDTAHGDAEQLVRRVETEGFLIARQDPGLLEGFEAFDEALSREGEGMSGNYGKSLEALPARRACANRAAESGGALADSAISVRRTLS
jgi:hypothetical protein